MNSTQLVSSNSIHERVAAWWNKTRKNGSSPFIFFILFEVVNSQEVVRAKLWLLALCETPNIFLFRMLEAWPHLSEMIGFFINIWDNSSLGENVTNE